MNYKYLFRHYISNVDRYSQGTFYFLLNYTFQNYLLTIFVLQLRIWKSSNFFEQARLRPYAFIQQLTISRVLNFETFWIMHLWKIKYTQKKQMLYYNIHLKKLFDVLYQFSLRKHFAKAVSSGSFVISINYFQVK